VSLGLIGLTMLAFTATAIVLLLGEREGMVGCYISLKQRKIALLLLVSCFLEMGSLEPPPRHVEDAEPASSMSTGFRHASALAYHTTLCTVIPP